MELIDSHCHLYLPDFADDIDEVMERARNAGIKRFYLPSIDGETEPLLFALEARFPGECFAMQGLHPCSVKEDFRTELKRVETSIASRHFAAMGEIGLDFYWDRSFETQQYQAFHQQIEWALQYNLPIVIHSRQSMEQSIGVVRQHQKGNLNGIFHCFNEDEKSAREIVVLGFYLGIGGTLTYKKSSLPEVLKNIPLQHIVLETDAPYLPPVPFRGKRNESSYLTYIVSKLAEIKGVSMEEVASVTTSNALKIFGS